MNIISTEKAPGAIGPYSQGYTVGGLVFTSGQIPVDPATGAVAEGIAAQADQSCRNVGAILEAAGVGFDKVVKTTCFLADIADFAAFNEVYARYFTSKPARSCVAVKDLPKGVLCEIEAIAEGADGPFCLPSIPVFHAGQFSPPEKLTSFFAFVTIESNCCKRFPVKFEREVPAHVQFPC